VVLGGNRAAEEAELRLERRVGHPDANPGRNNLMVVVARQDTPAERSEGGEGRRGQMRCESKCDQII
jgi:hypothetical protein